MLLPVIFFHAGLVRYGGGAETGIMLLCGKHTWCSVLAGGAAVGGRCTEQSCSF